MQRTQWQYMTVEIDAAGFLGPKVNHPELVAAFDRYGADGWELVSALDLNAGEGRTVKIVAFFKRPVQ